MTGPTAHTTPLRPPARTLSEHIRRTVALAVPVMLSRAGLLIMITIATAMTGHAGPDEQAYLALGFFPTMVLLVIGIGLMTGVVVLSAQADGAGRPDQCGRIWRLGLLVAAALGVIYVVAMLWGEPLLLALGQAPDVAAGGGRVILMFAPGMPELVMFTATTAFLESINRPLPGMVVSLGANLVSVALCAWLIFGGLGLPGMGAAGAALGISLIRWIMLIAIVGYVLRMRDGDHYGVRAPLDRDFTTILKLLRVGTPLALAQALEATAFAMTTNFAGWLGKAPLAAFYNALNLNANVFMLAIGVATATSVRVANAVGRQDQTGIRHAGWVGAGLIIAVTLVTGLIISQTREPIAAFYAEDALVRALMVSALGIITWLCVVDSLQCVLVGATRGVADVIVPTLTQGIAFWGIAVPLAWWLAIHQGHGVDGLFWALGVSLIAASSFLALRFHRLTQRHILPV